MIPPSIARLAALKRGKELVPSPLPGLGVSVDERKRFFTFVMRSPQTQAVVNTMLEHTPRLTNTDGIERQSPGF